MKQISESVLKEVIKKRPSVSHKGDYGRILIIGGNENMGGAAIMSASAAVYSGAGLVTCASAPENRSALHARLPEAMFLDYHDFSQIITVIKSADVIVVGPGLGLSQHTNKLFALIFTHIRQQTTLIIDGSAITALAQEPKLLKTIPNCPIIYTPHQAEWQRLSGIEIAAQTPQVNQSIQQKLGATVILKKHHTEIYHADNSSSKIMIGGPYMATGGMGDTLTGIIAAFIGQFKASSAADVLDAAVYLHSLIPTKLSHEKYVVLPSDIISSLPQVMHNYLV
ncbi:NAD(P)H-hydrate dehydratase [Ligilactobacillus apodemi]|uniref:NAD(P)H-hydrate dehydratase n=1 Tax=Ligilactobacillus apodemi TaxID=307126 RepID=UPI000467FB9C|nr:NAD(P)H-hydrate dehydratase [Ligilactobacillus apodemi]